MEEDGHSELCRTALSEMEMTGIVELISEKKKDIIGIRRKMSHTFPILTVFPFFPVVFAFSAQDQKH